MTQPDVTPKAARFHTRKREASGHTPAAATVTHERQQREENTEENRRPGA